MITMHISSSFPTTYQLSCSENCPPAPCDAQNTLHISPSVALKAEFIAQCPNALQGSTTTRLSTVYFLGSFHKRNTPRHICGIWWGKKEERTDHKWSATTQSKNKYWTHPSSLQKGQVASFTTLRLVKLSWVKTLLKTNNHIKTWILEGGTLYIRNL